MIPGYNTVNEKYVQNCKLQIVKGCYLQARSNVSCHGTKAFQAPKLVPVQLLLSKQQSLRVGG